MDFLTDWLTGWLKDLLIDGIMGNLGGLFDNVNASVGDVAAQVGTTPAAWNAGVFSLIQQLSETVILPIAGMVLTFVATYELIQMLLEKNNMHEVDVANIYKWMFKTAIAILILSNTFRMGVVGMSKTLAREVGQYGILVNTMGPGRIYTDRIKYLNKIRGEKMGITEEEYTARDCVSFPQKRYQTVEEYGRMATFLCSPANSAVSGQYLLVDGAMTTAY